VLLEKLEIFGFKSFAHKLSLEFGPGITGVVGPNGCGKTNVADAIRWVLGEQSPSELRGSSMSDVIFNGTKKRRRLGMAEVTLTIDNSSGFLPTDFSEVVIGRRVFRSGESEYLLNKTSCRLRDIKDLFLDTGVGTRTYSLIERRMVDSVLSDSAGHRRFMFEEAAGIMKYKIRKRSALNKLQATEADMQRVADIITEVEKQVRSLKRQVSQASRHRRYTDELRDLEVKLGRREHARWAAERAKSADAARELRQNLDSVSESLRDAERRGLGIRTELRDKDEALARLELEIGELESRARDLAEGMLVARERRSASARRIEELDVELTDLRADLSLALRRAGSLEDEIRQASQTTETLEADLKERERSCSEAEREYRGLRDRLAGQKQTRIEGLESSAGIKGELESYRARLDDLQREHVEIENALVHHRGLLCRREADILDALDREKEQMAVEQRARESSGEASKALETARERLAEARERRTRLEGELAAAKHKLALLEEIRDGYSGFKDGVRSLLRDRSHGIEGLVGTVADIVDVDPALAHAFEAAFGTTGEYVVAESLGVCRRAMDYLSRGAHGRATFLPLAELDSLSVESPPSAIADRPGVIGPAARYVRVDDRYRHLVDFLLENVVLVETLDAALALSNLPEARRLAFVTSDGQAVTKSGVLTGGKRGQEDRGLLRRGERVETASREVRRIEGLLGEARRAETEASDAIAGARAGAERSEAALEQAAAALWEVKRRATELELAKTNTADLVGQLTARRDALAARMKDTCEGIEELASRLERLSKGEDEIGERLEELERRFRDAERARSHSRETEKRTEIETAAARSALTQLRAEHAQLAETARSARSSIEKKTMEREEHARTVKELQERIERESVQHGEIVTEKKALETNRDSIRAAAATLREGIEKLDAGTREARSSREDLQSRIHELEIKETELRGRCDALRERLLEEYSVDPAALGDFTPDEDEPFDEAAAKQEIERLRARLRSMGPVNLLALEEYDEESKRLEFLEAQFEDLERSKQSLQEAIEKINSTATRMFLDTFQLVRTNFVDMFRRLFEGGEADLRLLEPDLPLESPIEIVASPKGKRLGRLSLLSSGESALTAIALLFAIYLVKPSPFCILDEVDAPLDDANVKRYIRMLQDFSERTQFVVITHNKLTMQAGDRLYGITMEESGVSKVVSVRLDGRDSEVPCEEAVREAV